MDLIYKPDLLYDITSYLNVYDSFKLSVMSKQNKRLVFVVERLITKEHIIIDDDGIITYPKGWNDTYFLRDVERWNRLKHLHLTSFHLVHDVSKLTSLTYLNISGFCVKGIEVLTNLTSLNLYENHRLCHALGKMEYYTNPNISALTNLVHLSLAPDMIIPDFYIYPRLISLELKNSQIHHDILKLTNLTHLNLSGNRNYKNTDCLVNLLSLDLSYNKEITNISVLTNLTNLNLSNNKRISNINDLTNLTYLDLSFPSQTTFFEDTTEIRGPITDIRHLTNLTKLNIRGNSIELIPNTTSLQVIR